MPDPKNEDETHSRGARVPEGRLALLVQDRNGTRSVELPTRGQVVVGRDAACDVVIDDRSISRKHVALHVGPPIVVLDLGSRNGTSVGDRNITAGQRTTLSLGATIDLGGATLVLYRSAGFGGGPAAAALRPEGPAPGPGTIVVDPSMQRLYAMLDVIAPSSIPVLLLGETGTGKEVFARAVHERSGRAKGPYVAMSSAAVPDTLLESELFGFEKGAFSGATTSKPGLIESADGGTFFLDEIGELPLPLQAKLLRILESGETRRLGSLRSTRVDVRYVAATHRDLQALVHANRFRADLFFRLNGFALVLPPLRARQREIVPLAEHFLAATARASGAPPPPLTDRARDALLAHGWPGNVRELRHVVERAAALARGQPIQPEHLMLEPPRERSPGDPREGSGDPSGEDEALSPEEAAERTAIVDALARTSGNQTEAAKLLAMPRRTLIRKIERYRIARPRKGSPTD